MGNEVPEVDSKVEWQWVSNEKGVQIYRNKDGRLAEKRRIVVLGNYTLSQQNKVYEFRANNSYGLVKSYQTVPLLDKQKNQQHLSDLCRCANQKIQLDVYTERIPYRLSDLPQLTFLESLSFLRQTATAYEIAYKKLGGLHINPQLIGVTDKGEIRAWVNENWALNHPSHYIPILKCSSKKEIYDGINPQLRDQSEMICNLITVIEAKNQNGRFPSPFAQLLKNKCSNFRILRRFLNQFITSNKLMLPETINKNFLDNKVPLVSSNHHINNSLYPVGNKIAINSSRDSYDTQFQRVNHNNNQRPVFVNSIPHIPFSNYNAPNLTFNNQNQNRQISIRKQSIFPINHMNSYASSSFPTFNSQRPQLVNIQKQQINSLQNAFRPYQFQPKLETNSYASNSDNNKPLFNGLKFTLLPSSQLPLQQKVVDYSSRPNSPLGLNQLMQKDEVKHQAAYQIVEPTKSNS